MKYWLILGIKDTKFVSHIKKCIDNFNNNNFKIVIVKTKCDVKWPGSNILDCDEPGVVPFLNTALDFIKKNASSDDWLVRIDSDDYYGPLYLDNIDYIRKKGAMATGIKDVYVKTEDSSLIFCKALYKASAGVPGGTLASRVDKCLPFRSSNKWGEDYNWCYDMNNIGISIMDRIGTDYSMIRWKDHNHTFPIKGHELPFVWFCEPYFEGTWSQDKVQKAPTLIEKMKFDNIAASNAAKRIFEIQQMQQ